MGKVPGSSLASAGGEHVDSHVNGCAAYGIDALAGVEVDLDLCAAGEEESVTGGHSGSAERERLRRGRVRVADDQPGSASPGGGDVGVSRARVERRTAVVLTVKRCATAM